MLLIVSANRLGPGVSGTAFDNDMSRAPIFSVLDRHPLLGGVAGYAGQAKASHLSATIHTESADSCILYRFMRLAPCYGIFLLALNILTVDFIWTSTADHLPLDSPYVWFCSYMQHRMDSTCHRNASPSFRHSLVKTRPA
jgi:hypothetical protein